MILALLRDCAKTKHKLHRPLCGDDTCTLPLGVGMHQAMVWSKAADHRGASGIASSAATRVDFFDPKSVVEVWYEFNASPETGPNRHPVTLHTPIVV